MGGLMSITGLPGQGPVRVGIPVADLTRRPVLRARHPHRAARARGVGRRASSPDLAAAGADLHARLPGGALADRKEVPKQAGNDHPTSIPTGVFKTTDGHINIATTGGAIWERFCKALGAEAMLKNPDYASAKARSENRKALNAEIDTYTAKKIERRVDRHLQRGRRAVRADLHHRPGVRRSAGQASRHRAERQEAGKDR